MSDLDPDLAEKARDVLRRIRDGQRRTSLVGPAGTGKTSLIEWLTQQLDGAVEVITFTGKAAHVLRRKRISNARTIHSAIYLPHDEKVRMAQEVDREIERLKAQAAPRKDIARLEARLTHLLQPSFVLNEKSVLANARLCIIDEVSMVDGVLGQGIEHFDPQLLVVGDPYQLPPVGGAAHFSLSDPDVQLTKILRQGPGSRIIDLATAIRGSADGSFDEGSYGGDGVEILQFAQTNAEQRNALFLAADVIICSTNKTRRAVNQHVLKLLGHVGKVFPEGTEDEVLINLRNDAEFDIENGRMVRLVDVENDPSNSLYLTGRLLVDDGDGRWAERRGRALVYKGFFDPYDPRASWQKLEDRANIDIFKSGKHILRLDWGYCITTHKAQGSEWPRVLFLSEPQWPKEPVLRRQLRYTAVSRASDELSVIMNWGVR